MTQQALQAAIDAIEASRGNTDPLVVAKVRALMFGYAYRWAGDDYVTISAEEAYHLPVINPATGAASRTFTQGGKFDGVIERDGKVYLLEHKCLPASAVLRDYSGGRLFTVQDWIDGKLQPTLLGLDATGLFAPHAANVWKNCVNEIVEVKSKSGRIARTSVNHPFLTQRGWVPAGELSTTDWIGVPKSTQGVSTEDFSDSEIEILGYMLGDGNVNGNAIQWTKSDGPVFRRFVDLVEECGHTHGISVYKSASKTALGVRVAKSHLGPLPDLMRRMELDGKTAANKSIPNVAISDRQALILIGAMWATDGCVDTYEEVRGGKTNLKPRIAYVSRSRELCDGLLQLLTRVGLRASLTESSVAYKGARRPVFTVKVVGRKSKLEFLDSVLSGRIPMLKNIDQVSLARSAVLEAENCAYGADNRGQPKQIQCDRPCESVFWERVASVSGCGREMTYHVSVPGAETFIVGDMITHNSSSEDIADPDAVYWRRLEIDSQVSHYVMANWMMERKVTGTLYDVVKKPGISPRRLTEAERKGIVETGEYFGFKVSDAELARVKDASEKLEQFKQIKKEMNAANKKAEKAGEPVQEIPQYVLDGAEATVQESLELYECRLARDCIENGSKYYQRKEITRLDQDIAEYAGELWDVAQSMLHARNNQANYRNSGACMTYGSPCEYLGVCSGFDSIDSPNWERSESVHSELPIIADNGGRDLLTNSRLKCFQTCRRKHFYRYELGVRRVGGEDKEALVFGSLLHTGLENFWNCFRKDNSNASSNGVAPGNEAVGVSGSQQRLFGSSDG